MTNNLDKTVVYTAILGNIDYLRDPKTTESGFDYVCFTDNAARLNTKIWNIIEVKPYKEQAARENRRYKILPHLFFPKHGTSIWIDANISITSDLRPLIQAHLSTHPLAMFKHPQRNCIYKEGIVCSYKKLDSPDLISKQMNYYRSLGYPQENGLVSAGVILRQHHNPKVVQAMEAWWGELSNFSRRDQLSFNFVAWKYKLNFKVINGNIALYPPYFQYRLHGTK
jgi:hypothetical protein